MTSMQIPVLEIDDAPKTVYTWLRDMILSGQFPAGDQVKIRAIADEMRISIVPVREAIRMLATEGLMELRPRRSPIVAPLELPEILEINNIRLALEPVFLEHAVDAHTGASIAKCRALIDADKASTDYNEKVDLNRQFHLALLEPAAQPRALKIIHDQFESIARFAQILVMHGADEMRGHVHYEHLEILEAVAAKEADRAVGMMRQHISSAVERVEQELNMNQKREV